MWVASIYPIKFDLIASIPPARPDWRIYRISEEQSDVPERWPMIEVKRIREGDPLEFEVSVLWR
jgi:hypothetical protein